MPIITLLTDFGEQDGYVAAMKGAILNIAPQVTLVDITHAISPQAIVQGAYVLHTTAPYFPTSTIHIAVVDPGVGGVRRPIAIKTEHAVFVGPDNGIFTHIIDSSTSSTIVKLDQPQFWLPNPSNTFHGRDLFAPVAAHLANGVALKELGQLINDPVKLKLVQPERLADGALRGTIVHVDRFGNLISNLPATWFDSDQWEFHIENNARVETIQPSYASAPIGAAVAYRGSASTLEIAVRNGDAARHFNVEVGAVVVARRLS